MPTALPKQRVAFENNVGGINDAVQPTKIQPYEAQEIRNVRLSPNGAISERNGYFIVNTASIAASAPIVGIHHYRRFSGNDDLVLCLNTGTATDPIIVKRDSAAATTFTQISTSTVWSGGTPTFAASNDTLIISQTNGDNVQQWDGSATVTSDLSASAPVAHAVSDFRRHVIFMDIPARPGNWEFSVLGDPTSARDSDRVPVDRPTKGAHTLYGDHIIGTTERLVLLSGNDRDNFRQDPIRDSVGIENQRSFVNVENANLLVWPWRGRFYEFDGIRTRVISNRLGRILLNTSDYFNLSLSGFSSIQGVNIPSQSRVAFLVMASGDSQAKYILNYWYDLRTPDPEEPDFAVGAWTLDVYDRAFASIGVAVESGDEVLYAGTYDGQLCRLDVGNGDSESSSGAGDGVAIESRYQTGPITGGVPELTKRWRDFLAIVKQTGTYSIVVDFGESFGGGFTGTETTQISLAVTGSSALWGTAVWGTDVWASSLSVQKRVRTGLRAESIVVRFSANGTNIPWQIESFYFHFQQLPGLRRFP